MKQMSIHILFFILILFLKGPFLKRQNRLNNIFFNLELSTGKSTGNLPQFAMHPDVVFLSKFSVDGHINRNILKH